MPKTKHVILDSESGGGQYMYGGISKSFFEKKLRKDGPWWIETFGHEEYCLQDSKNFCKTITITPDGDIARQRISICADKKHRTHRTQWFGKKGWKNSSIMVFG